MIRKFLFILFLGGLIVFTSFLFSWYFGLTSPLVWRLDNILHFIGGIYAFFFIRFIFCATRKYHNTETAFLMKVIIFAGGALIMGLLWEWYEFVFIFKYGTLALEPKGISVYFDTMIDLMFDLLGALISGIYLIIKNGKNK